MSAFHTWFAQLELLPFKSTHQFLPLCDCLSISILWYKIFNTRMLTMDHRYPTLNISNAGIYGLDIICYGSWYHELDNLDNEYRHRDQTSMISIRRRSRSNLSAKASRLSRNSFSLPFWAATRMYFTGTTYSVKNPSQMNWYICIQFLSHF